MSCEGDKRPRVSGSVRKGRLVKHGVWVVCQGVRLSSCTLFFVPKERLPMFGEISMAMSVTGCRPEVIVAAFAS